MDAETKANGQALVTSLKQAALFPVRINQPYTTHLGRLVVSALFLCGLSR